MAKPADVRRIALSMPEAEEKQHMGTTDFRVRNKIFATLPAGDRAVIKVSPADQTALLQMDPKAFSLNAWSHQGWTNVHLAKIGAGALRGLIENAWRHVAPKRLVAASEAKRKS